MAQHRRFTAANVEETVVRFFCVQADQDSHAWLAEAQTSPDAWTFAWDLLSPSPDQQKRRPEVEFFGASTIALKVGRFWAEVPEDQYEGLRQRITELLLSYQGPHIVRTRLCVAMASLIIHSLPDKWPDPVADLMNHLLSSGQVGPAAENSSLLLFELLTVIPEEYSTIAMPSRKRAQVRASLSNSLRHVLPLILQQLSSSLSTGPGGSGTTVVQAIKALQAWVQFGVPLGDGEVMWPLIQKVLDSVRDEELFDSSIDALSSIISHPDTHNYPGLLRCLLKKALDSLEPMLASFMGEGSYEMANPLACLFVTFGESHSRLVIDWATSTAADQQDGQELATRLLYIILGVSGVKAQYPVEETISEMPFGFWYIFQDDILSCDPPQMERCSVIFGPIYHTLVDSLLRKAMYNLKEKEWTPDQRELFRCYRTDIADTIMYCYNILRQDLLRILLNHLEQASALVSTAGQAQHWPYLEATLFMWSAVAEALAEDGECDDDDEEDDEAGSANNSKTAAGGGDRSPVMVTQFLAKLPGLPYNDNMRVIASALDCIGGFAEWLALHQNLLPHVAPIVTRALQNPDLALSASMALKDMCRDCAEGMRPYAAEVVTACQEAMASGRLRSGECVRLMYPVGKMLSHLPDDQVLPRLEPILVPYLTELQQISVSDASGAQLLQMKPRLDLILKLLTMLFQSIQPAGLGIGPAASLPTDDEFAAANHKPNAGGQARTAATPNRVSPVVSLLLPQVYPLLKQVAQRWASVDQEITDTMCSLLKQCLTTMLDFCDNGGGGGQLPAADDATLAAAANCARAFAEDLVDLIGACYETSPQSCMLELAKTVVVAFSGDQKAYAAICRFFKRLVDRTMREVVSSGNPSDFADLIAAFFAILSHIVKKAPILLLLQDSVAGILQSPQQQQQQLSSSNSNGGNDNLHQVFMAACGCLGMPESSPVKYAAMFLSNLINASADHPELAVVVRRGGESLFTTTIRCLGGSADGSSTAGSSVSRSYTDYYVDVLFALNRRYFDDLRKWLAVMVDTDNFPSPHVSREQKQEFATFVLKERSNKRKLQEGAREFSLTCCGLGGSGVDQALLMGRVMSGWDRVGLSAPAVPSTT